jgi:hypothetical protein
MFVATGVGLFKTSDGGDTWLGLYDNLPANNYWKLLVTDNALFAASPCLGVYTSSNGFYWRAINDGLGDLCVYDFALNESAHRLYVGTLSGVWVLDLNRSAQ